MKIVLATRNPKKVEEIRRSIPPLPRDQKVSLFGLGDFSACGEVVEDGATFAENAVKKAVVAAQCSGLTALADDSGLEVEALGGRPGVHSARFAGPGSGDKDNLEKLLADMVGIPEEKRAARFVCVLALANPDGGIQTFQGEVRGRITFSPRGANGFGYDPVFLPEGEQRTFAEMAGEEKDAMSHRGRALHAFFQALRANL